jgi:hypothetical protein
MSATATLDNPTMDPSAINEEGFTTPMAAWERFDASAQRYLGIGGSEYLTRLDDGQLDLDDADVAIVYAVMPLEHRKAV